MGAFRSYGPFFRFVAGSGRQWSRNFLRHRSRFPLAFMLIPFYGLLQSMKNPSFHRTVFRWALGAPLLILALPGNAALEKPVLVQADGEPIKVQSPGYACPVLADWDGDGKPDLLVGQFNGGKVKFFKNLGGEGLPKYAKAEFVKTDGKPLEVPGVW